MKKKNKFNKKSLKLIVEKIIWLFLGGLIMKNSMHQSKYDG